MESSLLLWPSLLDVPLLIIGGRVSLEVRCFYAGLCLSNKFILYSPGGQCLLWWYTILVAGWNTNLILRTQPGCSQFMASGEWVLSRPRCHWCGHVTSLPWKLFVLCSGLWGLIGTGLFVAGPESECNLHATFEGLCYCELRLPPAVCWPSSFPFS